MATEKMDASAVYVLFEEQIVVEQGKKENNPTITESPVNIVEITGLKEELQKVTAQKQFTPEQIEELEQLSAAFTSHALKKSFEKLVQDFNTTANLVIQIGEKIYKVP